MGTKLTQIRLTNLSKNEAEIDFKDVINGVDLSDKGLRYDYEGVDGDGNKKKEAHHMRIMSTGVLKSINKMIYPDVELKDYKKSRPTQVDVPIKVKPEKVKLVLDGMNHIVVAFYH